VSRPRLHSDDLDNESRVLGAVDAVMLGDDNYGRHTRKILAAQDRLQALCDEDAWIAFLDIEAAVNDRVNMMLATVARWAFNEGRRSRRGDR
jgi:hypothetical protein